MIPARADGRGRVPARVRCRDYNRPLFSGPAPTPRPAMTADPATELHTIIDLIRYGGSRFNQAGLTFGHSYDNAMD